jgi:hypothetical protein
MSNRLPIILLLLFVAGGTFPKQGHDLVDLAANIVSAVYGLLQGQGVHINQNSVETVVTLAIIAIAIGAFSSAIGGGKLFKGGR